jgi:hypothetical protein
MDWKYVSEGTCFFLHFLSKPALWNYLFKPAACLHTITLVTKLITMYLFLPLNPRCLCLSRSRYYWKSSSYSLPRFLSTSYWRVILTNRFIQQFRHFKPKIPKNRNQLIVKWYNFHEKWRQTLNWNPERSFQRIPLQWTPSRNKVFCFSGSVNLNGLSLTTPGGMALNSLPKLTRVYLFTKFPFFYLGIWPSANEASLNLTCS